MTAGVELAYELPFYVEFQEIRNIIYRMGQKDLVRQREKAGNGNAAARPWVATFEHLAEVLKIRMGKAG